MLACQRCPDRAACKRRQLANYYLQAWIYTFVRPECEQAIEPTPPPRHVGFAPRILELLAGAPGPLSSEDIRIALGVPADNRMRVQAVRNAVSMLKKRGAIVGVGWIGRDDAGAVRLWALTEDH